VDAEGEVVRLRRGIVPRHSDVRLAVDADQLRVVRVRLVFRGLWVGVFADCECDDASAGVGGDSVQRAAVAAFVPHRQAVVHAVDAFRRDARTGEGSQTENELVDRMLDHVAGLPEVAAGLRLDTRVVSVGREGLLKHEAIGNAARRRRPFRLLLRTGDGEEEIAAADVVLDCTGTYGNPNALGDGGIPAPGERDVEDRILRHVPDVAGRPEEWASRELLLVGAGHSAQTAARDLARLLEGRDGGTTLHWALRSEDPGWYRVDDDPLPERDRLTARAEALAADPPPGLRIHRGVVVESLPPRNGRVRAELRRRSGPPEAGNGAGAVEALEVDRVVSLTGYVGDHTLYRQLQVHECYATCGPMNLAAELLASDSADCLDQESHGVEALENPEPNFYILGEKSYGRNNTFLMTMGWEQVDQVFGALEERAT
jgi:hypothetical protein